MKKMGASERKRSKKKPNPHQSIKKKNTGLHRRGLGDFRSDYLAQRLR